MKLLNLDKFIGEKRAFKIQGMEFYVPGLISVEKVLKVSKLGQDATTNPDKIDEVLQEIWGLLAPANDGKTEQEFRSRISAPMLQELLPFIFNDQGGEDVDSGIVDLSKNGSGGVEQSKS
jgi:hypothetical protein